MGERKKREPEYIWRFKLSPEASKTDDPLEEMLTSFIAGFLEIGCFTRKGRNVTVDGFRLNDRKGISALTPKKGG